MGVHTKKRLPAESTSGIVVGSGKRHWGIKRRLTVLVAAGALLLAVIIAGTMAVVHRNGNNEDKIIILPAKELTPSEQIDQAVNKTVQAPDYDAGTAALKAKLAKTSDPTAQANIYVQLAAIAVQQQDYKGQIQYDLQAIKLDGSKANVLARNVADAYNALGQNSEALTYYKQALAFYQAQPDSFSGKIAYINDINAKITELQR